MANLSREDFKDIYIFAAQCWVRFNRGTLKKSALQGQAVKVMDLCESVLGEQWYRPDRQTQQEITDVKR